MFLHSPQKPPTEASGATAVASDYVPKGAIPKKPFSDGTVFDTEFANISVLSKAQRYIKQRVTKLCNKVESQFDTLTTHRKFSYIENLKDIRKELKDAHTKLLHLHIAKETEDSIIDEFVDDYEENYDDRIERLISQLKPLYGEVNHDTQVPFASSNQVPIANPVFSYSTSNSRIRLPELPLPTFSNAKDEEFEKFIYSFESIIEKHNLPAYEKFVYLRNQLSKAPRVLIDSLDCNDQTYETAKTLLVRAFSSDVAKKYTFIKRLSKLSLPSSGDPYEFIGEMRTLINSFRTLNITVETVLNYFIWNGMNDSFQNQFIQILNENKPSLPQIEEKIFEATERYIRMNSKPTSDKIIHNKISHKKDSGTYAIKVNKESKNSRLCILCKSDKKEHNHYISQCTVYDVAYKKVNKLKALKACTKCAFLHHEASNCHFKFYSKCKNCNESHMTFLCTKRNYNTSTNLNCTKSCTSNSGDSILLPTLTLNIGSQNKGIIRALKDGGSQRNFVSKSAVLNYKLPVICKVTLSIHGFNSTKTIDTEIVKISLSCGDCKLEFEAVVIPNINISFKVMGLQKLVHSFLNKGYQLADSLLEKSIDDTIGNIELIIGAESEHLLDINYIKFGKSCYFSTPAGVMFTGCIKQMLGNIKFLADLEDNKTDLIHSYTVHTSCFISKCETHYDKYYEPLSLPEPASIPVLDKNGEIIDDNLVKATEEVLNEQCNNILNYDKVYYNSNQTEANKRLIGSTLNNSYRSDTGRLVMPLMWNPTICHQLGLNFNLSRKILESNVKKLKQANRLTMYDEVFRNQEEEGIIERIHNVEQFIVDHPECSFLPHMGVFRPDRETTKTRVVFLSNLTESSRPPKVSHNQAMLPGVALNNKITISLMLTRFDAFVITFDLRKAFLQILLPEVDQNRLCFLWYNNIRYNDFSLVAFKNLRLTFGLRPSPCILMLALYKILIIDADSDPIDLKELKKNVYNMMYMDNGSATCNSVANLEWIYETLPHIFKPYHFDLQQYICNNDKTQQKIDKDLKCDTPRVTKLLGTLWDRIDDSFMPQPLKLDEKANTKRKVLSTINAIYDLFGLYAPLLNRARLFLQQLQSDSQLSWDDKLNEKRQKEWINIVNQCNSTPVISLKRFVGARNSNYALIAFTDASRQLYGVVVYILDLNKNHLSFLIAKSRVVNKQLQTKSIPALEFHAIAFGVETLISLYNELSGDDIVIPINVSKLCLFTDSMVAIHWLDAYSNKFGKMQKLAPFIMNRIETIDTLCRTKSVTFNFTEGKTNPADAISRPFSYRRLQQTCYHTGPNFLTENKECEHDLNKVTIPNPITVRNDTEGCHIQICTNSIDPEIKPLVPVDSYSDLGKLIRVTSNVLRFINTIRMRLLKKHRVIGKTDICMDEDIYRASCINIILCEQKLRFPEVFKFFLDRRKIQIPDLVMKLNLFQSTDGLIRVKSKLNLDDDNYPILLPGKSILTNLIIYDTHIKIKHGGIYSVLKELRLKYWILHYYSSVKKVIKECVRCGRYNSRPVKLNQNAYRAFRESPPTKPFSSIFLDYMGPWSVTFNKEKRKIYILIITCLYTRAINLMVCVNADTSEFLRAMQLQVYEYGMFTECRADLGSQITAGFNLLRSFFSDSETKAYFHEKGIKCIVMEQYPKGNSALGSLVEALVKQTKYLINKSITNKVLDFFDFRFIVCQAKHMINRRPIAFKEGLRGDTSDMPEPISPEMLLHGFSLISLNTIPDLQPSAVDHDVDWNSEYMNSSKLADEYIKIRKAREKLNDLYHSEFMCNLINQSVDQKHRYKPVKHSKLDTGDLVLLVDKFLKPTNYPMGRIVSVETNNLGESTAAWVLKSNREKVYRHASSLILLLKGFENSNNGCPELKQKDDNIKVDRIRTKRNTAIKADKFVKLLAKNHLV